MDCLKVWQKILANHIENIQEKTIDYVYHEKSTGFHSKSQYLMQVLKCNIYTN